MTIESKVKTFGGYPRATQASHKVEKLYFRDALFAVLWIVQLFIVVSSAIFLRPSTSDAKKKDDDEGYIETALLSLALLIVPLGAALIAVCMVFLFMSAYSQQVIRMAFFSPTLASIATSVVATYNMGRSALPLWYATTGVAAASAFMYFWVRRYVPFAASTLRVSLQALRDHKGLIGMALFTSTLVFAWFAVWAVASLGIYQYRQRHPRPPQVRWMPCEHDPRKQCSETVTNYEPFYLTAFLLLSLYWTSQVLSNILHTATVGTVASWWTSKSKNQRALREALYRACTTSLGSICLGSLVVAIVSTLETIVSTASNTQKKMEEKAEEAQRRERGQRTRRQHNGAANAIVKQLLQWLRKISEYINSWAFVYVGLYGDTYWTAGKKVSSSLFSKAGRPTFVSDRLVYRVLGLMKVAIALLSGALLVATQVAFDWTTRSDMHPSTWRGIVFSSGVVVGYWVSSVSLSVLESIARTVIVCFLENPDALQSSHSALHKELQHGWSTAYPNAWKSFKQKTL
jgi:hypothetical protein